jgi:hypothetical protein
MTAILTDNAASWRSAADADNPAGPLFSTEYAEADLVSQDPTFNDCSLITGSLRTQCCA